MRLTRTEIDKIADAVVKQWKTSGIKVADEEKASAMIGRLINENIEEERKLEDDSLRLLKLHSKEAGASFDQEKALRMIKQKLAEERKFVL